MHLTWSPSDMTHVSRVNSFVVLAAAVIAIATLDACSNDSTSPSASLRADTLAVPEQSTVIIQKYFNSGDSSYDLEATTYDGAYVETIPNGGNSREWRIAFEIALPTLAKNAVIDSARFYQHVCYTYGAQDNAVVLDHLNWGASYGVAEAFEGQALQANIGTIASDTSTGWKSMLVTSSVQADYAAKRATSQFRERYNYSAFPASNNSYVEFGPMYCNQADSGQPYFVVWSH